MLCYYFSRECDTMQSTGPQKERKGELSDLNVRVIVLDNVCHQELKLWRYTKHVGNTRVFE